MLYSDSAACPPPLSKETLTATLMMLPGGDRATEEDEKEEGDDEAPADVQKRLGGEINERSLKHIAPEALDLASLATDGPLVHAYDDTPPLGWDRHMHIDSAARSRSSACSAIVRVSAERSSSATILVPSRRGDARRHRFPGPRGV
jgi:hypothetical protein